jgi:hypothetical protein
VIVLSAVNVSAKKKKNPKKKTKTKPPSNGIRDRPQVGFPSFTCFRGVYAYSSQQVNEYGFFFFFCADYE